jgi:hypothetical protein
MESGQINASTGDWQHPKDAPLLRALDTPYSRLFSTRRQQRDLKRALMWARRSLALSRRVTRPPQLGAAEADTPNQLERSPSSARTALGIAAALPMISR